jgi:hypothetical protein
MKKEKNLISSNKMLLVAVVLTGSLTKKYEVGRPKMTVRELCWSILKESLDKGIIVCTTEGNYKLVER